MESCEHIGAKLEAWAGGQYSAEAHDLAPYVKLALDAIQRPYPYHLSLYAKGDEEIAPAGQLTPAFAGAFDWHSSVHSHWTLLRCATRFPDAAWAEACRAQLESSLTVAHIEVEHRFMAARPTFERPYGLGWLLCLQRELDAAALAHTWAGQLASNLRPLSQQAAQHLSVWLPKLSFPIRSGVHSQTAFALGLAVDWADAAAAKTGASFGALVRAHAARFYGADKRYALHLEPSGEDFLSASLGAADLMRRVCSPEEFAQWFDLTLRDAMSDARFLAPVQVHDRTDGRISHLDGLHLSRAFMLLAISDALATSSRHAETVSAFRKSAVAQARAGLEAIEASTYAGTHWLGSFAVYLLTRAWSSADA